jgi:hypothetical protein
MLQEEGVIGGDEAHEVYCIACKTEFAIAA